MINNSYLLLVLVVVVKLVYMTVSKSYKFSTDVWKGILVAGIATTVMYYMAFEILSFFLQLYKYPDTGTSLMVFTADIVSGFLYRKMPHGFGTETFIRVVTDYVSRVFVFFLVVFGVVAALSVPVFLGIFLNIGR